MSRPDGSRPSLGRSLGRFLGRFLGRVLGTVLGPVLGTVLAFSAWPAAAVRAQFVAPEGANYHNGATLPLEDPGEGRTRIFELQDALARGDGDAVVTLMRTLRDARDERLVPFGARTWIGTLDRAAIALRDADQPEVLARVVADEAVAIEAARERRDLPELLDRAGRGRALPTAGRAALIAARLCFEEGRFAEAEVLAARAAPFAGAAELRAAARRHLPVETAVLLPDEGSAGGRPPAAGASGAPPAPGGPGADAPSAAGWRLAGGVRVRIGEDGDIGLPAAGRSGPDELALLSGRYLALLPVAGSNLPNGALDLLAAVATDPLRNFTPAPRAFRLARAGARWVFAYDLIVGTGWRLPQSTRQAHLLAVDVGPDHAPSLAWDARPAPGATESVSFGPPLVVGDRVYAQVDRVGLTTDVSLAAFDLATGKQLFETPLASAAQVRRWAGRLSDSGLAVQDKRASGSALAERDGVVHACTGFGVYAAVDALDGRILHAFRYDRVFSLESGSYDPAFLFDTGGWDDEPVRLWGDRVVVAPSDSRFLYVLADAPGPRGQLMLDDPIEKLDRMQVVTLRDDPGGSASPAFVCTRRSARRGGLVLLAPGGHVLAASPLLPDGGPDADRPDPRLAGYDGRPSWITGPAVASGSSVLVPSLDGVGVFDLSDLAAAPVMLPHAPGGPTAVRTIALDGDLAVSFAREESDSPFAEPTWTVHWYLRAP